MAFLRRKQPLGASSEKPELLKLLTLFKKDFYIVGLFSLIINLLMLVPAIYMLLIYDSVLASRSTMTLIVITIIMLFMMMLMGVFEWIRTQLLIRIGNNMDKRINARLFQVAFEKCLRTGSTNSSQVFGDFTTIRQFLTGTGAIAFFDVPWVPIYVFVIGLIYWVLGVYAACAALVLFILAVLTELASKKKLSASNVAYQNASAFSAINFRNADVIESMGMLSNVKKYWYPKHQKFVALQSSASEKTGNISATTKFFRYAFQSLIYAFGAYYVINGNIITAGAMVAAAILMGRALSPIDLAIGGWKGFVSARDSYKRLSSLFTAFPEREKGMPLPAPEGKIAASGLYAVPPNSNMQVLKNINFIAEKGDMVAIIGPSGSGKSTLSKLITGVWPPAAGSVRLDGAEIFTWDKDALGDHIGYLPQDIELLNGTIAENIGRFGDIDSEKIIEAAKTVGIHEMILNLPDGYDTFIGEGGVVLSGGQKQRVALARAIYGFPSLVVLDEPDSNLDDIGGHALLYTLAKLKERKSTVFIISHRNHILSVVDKILVISNGMVQMYGTRNDVLNAIIAAQNQQQAQAQAQAMQKTGEAQGQEHGSEQAGGNEQDETGGSGSGSENKAETTEDVSLNAGLNDV
jgi:ATP-binding cassette subfamily C exporter for protease/lipase/ATP-binding cassette subfamily C protein EexD